MLFDADGGGLKTAPAETRATHVRRHVALFWSCDPPEQEVGGKLQLRLSASGGKQNGLDRNEPRSFPSICGPLNEGDSYFNAGERI